MRSRRRPPCMRALLLAIALCGCADRSARTERAAHSAGAERPSAPAPRGILDPKDVARLQQALKARGYELTVTRALDAPTRRALREFQQQEQLSPTGMPDLATMARLELDAPTVYRNALD